MKYSRYKLKPGRAMEIAGIQIRCDKNVELDIKPAQLGREFDQHIGDRLDRFELTSPPKAVA